MNKNHPIKTRQRVPILFFTKTITTRDISLLLRQLATLTEAGIPLLQSIETIINTCKKYTLKQLLYAIKNSVQAGHSLSKTLQQHTKHFDQLSCQLIAAGEQSGTLDIMLTRIALHTEKTLMLKNKVTKALFYPVAVIMIAITVTIVLLIYVVPQFAELFSDFNAELPALTRFVITSSSFLTANAWIFLLCPLLIIVLIKLKRHNNKFSTLLEILVLKTPLLGQIITKATVASIARTLATTYASGVPLLESLQSMSQNISNALFKKALLETHDTIKQGKPLFRGLQNSLLFPQMAIQMVAIGEEAGKLEHMLEKVATLYENEADHMIDSLSQLLEPLIMALLGLIVGTLVVAMYLPIFKLGSVI